MEKILKIKKFHYIEVNVQLFKMLYKNLNFYQKTKFLESNWSADSGVTQCKVVSFIYLFYLFIYLFIYKLINLLIN